MCDILHVEWTLVPKTPPHAILRCSSCGDTRPFRSSGRTRLNANGKQLDAWLIYKCVDCDGTWNRRIFERQSVRSLDPALLEALQASAPGYVANLEFDAGGLKACAGHIKESEEIELRRRVLFAPTDWKRIAITLALFFPTSLRLDRLLAAELPLSRSRLQVLFEAGDIRVEPTRKDGLKRGIRDGTVITLGLRDEAERLATGRAAMGS
jgi:hypothetical protein